MKLADVCLLASISALAAGCGGDDDAEPVAPPGACAALAPDALHRFVLAHDTCVEPMMAEQSADLDDLFARALLSEGIFPQSLADFEAAMALAVPDYVQARYVISDTAHLPALAGAADTDGGLRYVVTWGPTLTDARIFLGVFGPSASSSLHEVIALDESADTFNFYELRRQVGVDAGPRVWSWAGDTRLAPLPAVDGHSCFNCHHTGRPIMRELDRPWPNWHSQRAAISAPGVSDPVATDPPFAARLGAEILAQAVNGAAQSHQARAFDALVRETDRAGWTRDGVGVLRHLLEGTSVNFASANVTSDPANTSPPGRDIDGVPPRDTFTWDSVLLDTLRLDYRPLRTTLPRADYDAFLQAHDFAIETRDARVAGSTYFAMFVPQAAAEDSHAVAEMLGRGIISPRLVLAVLMVDLGAAPLSAKRAGLSRALDLVDPDRIDDDGLDLSQAFADAVRSAGAEPCPLDEDGGASRLEAFDGCTAEAQFLAIWDAPDDGGRALAEALLEERAEAIRALPPSDQVDWLMRWSVERRRLFASTLPYCKLDDTTSFLPRTDLAEPGRCEGETPPSAVAP